MFTGEDDPFEIGKAIVMKPGQDVTIIAAGPLLHEALLAHEQLAAEGVSVRVINMHTVKPLDEAAVLAAAQETGAIVTVDEAQLAGGLGRRRRRNAGEHVSRAGRNGSVSSIPSWNAACRKNWRLPTT